MYKKGIVVLIAGKVRAIIRYVVINISKVEKWKSVVSTINTPVTKPVLYKTMKYPRDEIDNTFMILVILKDNRLALSLFQF
ncbi:hypothetical protein SRABI133_01138 [Peribacillus simplex]|uniref:Uncharacterized protein n=1 Tax=Peribacillus simplex TaxID=1478 RepID=A0A9W4KTA8_9BACI|nr:hypothetical protein SRABI133_01138 [Peribacillus simplex]